MVGGIRINGKIEVIGLPFNTTSRQVEDRLQTRKASSL